MLSISFSKHFLCSIKENVVFINGTDFCIIYNIKFIGIRISLAKINFSKRIIRTEHNPIAAHYLACFRYGIRISYCRCFKKNIFLILQPYKVIYHLFRGVYMSSPHVSKNDGQVWCNFQEFLNLFDFIFKISMKN